MTKTYYTYRIRVANRDRIQVEKWDAQHQDKGQPSGAFRYQENLAEIAPLLQAAKNNELNNSNLARLLGEALFNVLFDDVLRQDFVNFYYQVVQQEKQLLRVELDIDEQGMPEIAALPWKFMCVPARANLGTIWMGTVPDLVFSRRRSQWIAAQPIQLESDEKLRIALIISAPPNLPPVAYEPVQAALEKLAVEQENRVELLPIVSSANPEAIDTILSKDPHIFHFIGHGRMQNEGKQEVGEIALVDPDFNEAMWVDADYFSELFNQHRPGVVMLQACEGGMLSSSQAFVGVASKVVQQNVPVVVAMQYEVTNSTASRFALRFYQQLAAEDPVDIAAQYGRRAIALGSTQYRKRDFATPVIFMRVQDGYLFNRQSAESTEQDSDNKSKSDIIQIVEQKGENNTNIGKITGRTIHIGNVSTKIVKETIRACPTAPKPPIHFAGRRAELDHLKEVLSRGQSIAITGIQGMAGIGKTALVQQLANELSDYSAVLWASLGPNPIALNQLLNWARYADSEFDPSDNDLELIAGRVRALLTNLIAEQCPGSVMIILDDVWEGESVRVARLLQKAAPVNSVSIITTRSQLVVAQLRSTRMELTPMTPEDSLKMLRKMLSSYSELSENILLELAEVLGYHPLAMELAAGQIRLLERPEQDITNLIAGYRRGIPNGSPFQDIKLELGEDREDNLELVLSLSYAKLNETEQARFRALGILAYNVPFDAALCQAIWKSKPEDTIRSLQHCAMIALAEEKGFYQQHPLLHAYARALLKREGELNQIFNYYADNIIVVSEQFKTLPLKDWGELEQKIPHVHEVGDWLVKQTATSDVSEKLLRRAQNFAINTSYYISNRREVHRVDWLNMGLTASRQLEDKKKEVFFLNSIGLYYYALRDSRQALKFSYEAWELAKSVDDKAGEANACINLGIHYINYDLWETPKWFEPALTLFKEIGDTVGQVRALNYLSKYYADRYNRPNLRWQALNLLEQALQISQKENNQYGEVITLTNIGELYISFGENKQALETFEEALPLCQSMGIRDKEAIVLTNIATVYANFSQFQKSLNFLEQALSLFRSVGDRVGESTILRNMGEIYAHLGQSTKALELYKQALPILRKFQGFLDSDHLEDSTVPNFFSVELAKELLYDQAEQFRAKLHEELPSELGVYGANVPLPLDISKLLVNETILVKTVAVDKQVEWRKAVCNFCEYMKDKGRQWEVDITFAKALLDIIDDRQASLLPNSHYQWHIQRILHKIEQYKKGIDKEIPPDEIKHLIINTLTVKFVRKDKFNEWYQYLKKAYKTNKNWNSHYEKDFFKALIRTLENRVVSLSKNNPYQPDFKNLLDNIAIYEDLPVQVVANNTATVKTIARDKLADWKVALEHSCQEAKIGEDVNELAFFEALLAVLEDQPVSLPDENPYQSYLQSVVNAVASGKPISHISMTQINTMVNATVSVKTVATDKISEWKATLRDACQTAKSFGDIEELAFFEALLAVLDDQHTFLPDDNPYQFHLKHVLDAINGKKTLM
jgi:tetratricopeptide (TPR) repeat protein